MARHHLAVALLPPPRLGERVDTLRRAIRSSTLGRIPPHVTVVPPVNVRAGELGDVYELLDAAAAQVRPFRLRIGPASSFAPRTPTVHLGVRGCEPADAATLDALRRVLLQGPLDRPDEHPFTPHLTLDRRVGDERIAAAMSVLDGVDESWSVRSLHLLEHHRPEDGPPFWEPAHEVPLGPPAVVGRGGIELQVRTLGMLGTRDAEAVGLERVGPADSAVVVTAGPPGSGVVPWGAAVGTVVPGSLARLDTVSVVVGQRGQGIGAQVLAAWMSDAAARGATAVVADRGDGGDEEGFLARHGFVAVGAVMVRG